ncbi:FAD-dependent oxidoreductase [Desulfocicer niacini]
MINFISEKFSYLNDPPVDDAPFDIQVDEDKCIGCGLCVRQCPCQSIALVDRVFSEKQSPACKHGCPAGVDVRKYMDVVARGGSLQEAWQIITEDNPLPAITGRVCPHTCEDGCNRSVVDEPLNIKGVERVVGDYGLEKGLAFEKPATYRKERVAVIGSGPSGVSCAYQLAIRGYRVTIYEAKEQPGGKLRDAIPAYRLPKNIVDRELQRIFDIGIEVKCNTAIGKDITLDELKTKFAAVYVAIGAQLDAGLHIEGDEDALVLGGLEFLAKISRGESVDLGKRVLVIGGGNTAIDSARCARRKGSAVTVLYRRSRNEMPAYSHEVEEALAEGVEFEFLTGPVKIERNTGENAVSLTCNRMELCTNEDCERPRPVPAAESAFTYTADTVIAAVGLRVAPGGIEALMGDERWVAVGPNGQTSHEGVFAGGDVSIMPGTVSEAVGMGTRSAMAINAYLQDKAPSSTDKMRISYRGIPPGEHEKMERNTAVALSLEKRFSPGDAEVRLALTPEQIVAESKRCLVCGKYKSAYTGLPYFGKLCLACHNCESICPNGALDFPHYYKISKGRWTTYFDYPKNNQDGFPNPFMENKTPTYEIIAPKLTEVEQVIYKRRSVRMYTKESVPREMIHRILEAGRFAPSAGNSQPWRFVVIRNRELLTEISDAVVQWAGKQTKIYQGKDPLRSLIKGLYAIKKPTAIDQRPMVAMQALNTPKFQEGKMDIFFGASTCILLLQNCLGISNPHFGAGICAQNMVLAAHAMGLGTCYIGFASTAMNLDKKIGKYKKRFGVKWPYDYVSTILAVGYPAVETDKVLKRELPKVEWVE